MIECLVFLHIVALRGGIIMTMIVGWVAVDQRSPASAYIASDSRFTWGGLSHPEFDYGRKVFACKNNADIFVYCGDVLFSSIALGRVVEMADSGLLFEYNSISNLRYDVIKHHLQKLFSTYPSNVLGDNIQIYHISRDLNSQFHFYSYYYSKASGWRNSEITTDLSKSGVIFTAGIGKNQFDELYNKYQTGPNSDTSRNVFQCFCDCLQNKKPVMCGGAPQLVGLYRVANNAKKSICNGMNYGIIWNGSRYYLGSEIDKPEKHDTIRWYNNCFEICDCETMQRKQDAMIQPNPLLPLATS